MLPTLTICSDCERLALRRPRQGKALTEALACLTQLLLKRKRLEGLVVVRESCLRNCPMGRICVALQRGSGEVRHHLSSQDDVKAVAAKLAGTARRPSGST